MKGSRTNMLKKNFKKGLNVLGKTKDAKNGITLIALVITIIVLLILAGISIATLTGENGVLTKAQKAKTKTIEANLKEQIELAVLNSRVNENLDTRINLTTLDKGVNDIQEVTGIEKQGKNENLPWIVTASGFKFQIKEDGTVESISGISLSQTNLKIVEGTSETITATLTEGMTGTITWQSSNPSAITVNDGTVTAVASNGTATITASITSNGVTYDAKCEVTIVSKVTSITAENLTIVEGKTKPITVTTIPASNVEDLLYEPSNPNVVTVDANGNVTAKELGEGETTATATITIKGSVSGITGTCTVTVQATKKIAVGEFVEYDVSYTDVYYSTYNYSTKNGWRLLDFTDNKDGTYSNVKLISTGVPAGLHSIYTTPESWWVTDSSQLNNFKKVLGSSYQFYTGSATYYSLQMAAGLYYNFGSIPFGYGPYTPHNTKNLRRGYFISVTNGTRTFGSTSDVTNGNELFGKENVSNVRLMTLPEINKAVGRSDIDSMTKFSTSEDEKGMFQLNRIQNINGMSQYSYPPPTYNYALSYLASPSPLGGGVSYLPSWISADGYICENSGFSSSANPFGVRPVVCIDSSVKFKLSDDGTYFTME